MCIHLAWAQIVASEYVRKADASGEKHVLMQSSARWLRYRGGGDVHLRYITLATAEEQVGESNTLRVHIHSTSRSRERDVIPVDPWHEIVAPLQVEVRLVSPRRLLEAVADVDGGRHVVQLIPACATEGRTKNAQIDGRRRRTDQ